ncbi:P-loop containing nucleoside triphosphate hydrolase protein [Coemansia spiralis]|nr:P-loop containing nucleoside triphosphate hydrolase protein [Coemansia spiralis]
MPPPKGDYYTSPEPESTELDYEDTPRPPRKPRKTGPDKDAAPNDENVLMELTKKLLEIQTILKSVEIDDQTGSTDRDGRHSNALRLPSIVVIGSQSSGKSSVLEAIVGQEFLPKGNNMVTRRPIELTLVNTPHSEDEYGEFPQLGLDRIDDFRRIQRTLYDLNMSVPDSECVSDKPIELRIYSPHVPDLRLVDLPGYIQVVNRKQPPILRQKIRDLCEGYLKQPNIILAVCAADVDLANSEALKASRRNDPMGVRTIGVITKVDTTEPDTAVHMLTQNDYPLHLGYIAVKEKVGRSSHDILLSEAQYFGRHSEFQGPGVQVGVGTLRRKLVRVLEESMRRSLSSLVDAVRSELEETRYQIKVQYNDERISPESYVAESLDALKQRFKAFQQQFGKPQLRAEVQRWLESQVMNVCAELYWSNPGISGLSNHEDDVYWNHQLDRASALLTKSGVGRWTTQMVVDLLMENVTSMVDVEPFMHHPDSRAAVLNFSNAILRSKYHPTVDQVENTIKPFKYEVEIEPHEWKKAQKRSGTLIENEIRLCRQAMLKIRSSTPKKQLQQAIQFVKSAEKRGLDPIAVQTELARRNAEHSVDSDMGAQPKPDSATGTESGSSMLLALDATDGKAGDSSDSLEELGYAHFNPYLLRRAQQALMIQDRLAILHMRKKALSSSTCALLENKRLCPEVFLDVVAEKLAYNVVLFINYELLQDFFFQFPRELDSHLYYGKTLEQTREFASQNPRIGKHLTLLERRQKLELVMTRLQELVRQQVASEQYHGRGRNNGYTSSSSPFGRIIGSSE